MLVDLICEHLKVTTLDQIIKISLVTNVTVQLRVIKIRVSLNDTE